MRPISKLFHFTSAVVRALPASSCFHSYQNFTSEEPRLQESCRSFLFWCLQQRCFTFSRTFHCFENFLKCLVQTRGKQQLLHWVLRSPIQMLKRHDVVAGRIPRLYYSQFFAGTPSCFPVGLLLFLCESCPRFGYRSASRGVGPCLQSGFWSPRLHLRKRLTYCGAWFLGGGTLR